MATQNDAAWEIFLKEKGIVFDQPTYTVTADELKAITGREPRLLAKFDTPNQLAEPLKNAGYTVIPIRNGLYQLVKGDLFSSLPKCNNVRIFESATRFPLFTAGRGSSESQYIDQAYNIGLLADFLSIDDLYLTIRGRERTHKFTFQLSEISFDVDSVQIEVDAGYEAFHDIVLIEAKIGLPDHFNIRQLYYPYRHFSSLVPQKRVRNIFLAYDIPSTTYYLYEYIFASFSNPLSIELKQCTAYKTSASSRLALHALIDARFQTHNQIAPQANDFNKIVELLNLVDAGINNSEDVADYFVFDKRQSSYYREAAEYLGLITNTRTSGYTLTELGGLVLSEPPQTQAQILAKIVVNSWIFVALIQKAGLERAFKDSDIDDVIASAKNSSGQTNYSGSTVGRRRATIVAWVKWLAREIGCFEITENEYKIQ